MASTELRTAAQQALEALHSVEWHGGSSAWMLNDCKVEGAIHALRAALADGDKVAPTEPVQEPVAVVRSVVGQGDDGVRIKWLSGFPQIGDRLYTAPPQRRPLTEEEIDALMQSIGLRCADDGNERMSNHAEWERRERRRIARAIERAHGIGGQDD